MTEAAGVSTQAQRGEVVKPPSLAEVQTKERSTSPGNKTEVKDKGKSGQEAVRQFSEIVEAAITDQNKRPEALAAIAGWGMFSPVNARINKIAADVIELQKIKKLKPGEEEGFMKRIDRLKARANESFAPFFSRLDQIVRAEDPAKIDSFLRDLNYHYLQSEIKALESEGSAAENGELIKLKEDLKLAEKSREGLNPDDDEVVKFAKLVRGEKKLPDKFQDSPLEAIDDYFKYHLKKVIKDGNAKAKLTDRLGIESEDLDNLVNVYERGQIIDQETAELNNQVEVQKPGYVSNRERWVKRGATFGGILAALLALQGFMAIKKQSGESGQGRG